MINISNRQKPKICYSEIKTENVVLYTHNVKRGGDKIFAKVSGGHYTKFGHQCHWG